MLHIYKELETFKQTFTVHLSESDSLYFKLFINGDDISE